MSDFEFAGDPMDEGAGDNGEETLSHELPNL